MTYPSGSSPRSSAVRRVGTVVAVAVLLTTPACADTGVPAGTDPVRNASPVVTVPPEIGPQGCEPGSAITPVDEGLEVQGTMNKDHEELWALFATQDELTSGEPVPVYWRIGGDHLLRITLVGPNQRVVSPTSPVPGPHPTWERPGEPWTGTITFPQPGCWRLYVERGHLSGDLWVEVG
jgi:hypothetical protein